MIKRIFIAFSIALLFFLLFNILKTTNSNKVVKVIDGDTLIISNGKILRLEGINAPPFKSLTFNFSKRFLENLVLNKKVDVEILGKDSFGRYVAKVYINKKPLSEILIKNGAAQIHPKFSKEKLRILEKEAIEKQKGIWKRSKYFGCFKVVKFNYDPLLNDLKNLNKEFIIIKNVCNFGIEMNGWEISDLSFNIFKIKNFYAKPNQEFKIVSGIEKNSISLNSKFPVWNNDEDRMVLRDNLGNLVLIYSYSSK